MRTQTEQNERTLEEVAPGERGVILQVGNENGPVKRRLVDMGLTPGTEVTVRKVAPFGDPVELNLRGYELSLRKADAAQIRVATGAEGERRAQTRRRRIGMVQHIPDEETLRRMDADHAHEAAEHGGVPDYASHDTREMKLALVGNPNCGKTTLFNALTGSNQYVGNWRDSGEEGGPGPGGRQVRHSGGSARHLLPLPLLHGGDCCPGLHRGGASRRHHRHHRRHQH